MHLRAFFCAAAAVLSTFSSGAASAADKVGRYTVEIKVDGQQSWRAGNDWSKSTTTEHYRIVTHVKSTGELDSVNVKDPEFAQKQMQKAARVQQAVQKAQGRAPAAAPPTQEAYVAQQKKLAEQMQKGQAACKADTNCLMQLAMQYSQQSAAILPPGSTPAGGAVPDADEEAEDEERYLNYFGYEGCPTEIDIRIDQRSEGAYADVSGMIPWTTTQTGNSKGTDIDRKMQCLAATTVYDVKAKTIYTDGFGTPAVRGRYESNDKLLGKTVNTDAEIISTSEALEWVSQQMRQGPASGSKSTVLKPKNAANLPPGAKLDGQIKVSLTWRFDP
ncbi:hypothetical protein DFR24_2345 [Panacagrimonas perspica]|uniref:Uncharacterized protein n=1 Tax=Panacagrimonas perspica TaxID=381431 RepID=A0A4R7P2Y1_9GAMM|nr:hypothetical protein [Panacagrimonas perspica]TDU27987.1 hypothetical protein DFR24_2345 [Panacagrimonas perspica]THD01247.1 hypothetical protein B1810_20735 [Panacagrimonas perspica]